MEAPKSRIEFIDLAKGVCIILVICAHTGTQIAFPGANTLRMPLYYVLSGLFFKDYGSIKNLTKKKVNKLLVPFIVFYVGAYIVFYFFSYVYPGLIETPAHGILDVFLQRQYFNGPIWFLLSLFWANLLFYFVCRITSSHVVRGIIVACLGFTGVLLGQYSVFLPCVLDTSLTAMPFFFFGYCLKQSSILYPNRFDKYNVVIALALYGLLYLSVYFWGEMKISFLLNTVYGNYFVVIFVAMCGVISLLLLCKSIKTLPFVAFMGRFSVIPLLTHHMVYRPIKLFIPESIPQRDIIITIMTLLICCALIPICRKFIPWAVAQKDLIK